MSRRASTHKDPSEGIRQALGKHIKILLKTSVKLEKGGDKTDNRILVLTPHRMFVMTAKVPSKIDQHFHYLDIQAEMRVVAAYGSVIWPLIGPVTHDNDKVSLSTTKSS